MPTRATNRQYFRQLLQDRKIGTRKLAKLMDMHQASLVRAFQGKQPFKSHETAKLAAILSVPLEEVLRNLSIEAPPARSAKGGKVPVTGLVRAGKVEFGKTVGPRTVTAPPNETGAGMQALRYTDEGPLDGAYLYFRPVAGVQAHAIGRLCVCVVSSGDTVVGTPRPGATGAYSLRDLSGRVLMTDVWLESASPIVWIKTA